MVHEYIKGNAGEDGGTEMELLKRLERPEREYTPIPFWFLNGELRHGEIRRQLRDFRDHGVYGVVLHPRIGIPRRIEYLSPLFFRYMRTAVETAAELGMKVVLYDEGMYPSGSACGLVVRDHPEWASRGITLTETPGEEDLDRWQTEDGWIAERFSGGTLRGIHFGEDDGEPQAPRSADILNPEAVARFIELTHEAYWREFREWFGTTIIGFFTDEPSILGRNVQGMFPWTAGFAEEFQGAGGRMAGLRALFRGEENEDTALYHRMILEKEEKVYYGGLSRWCEEHGIALMGHPHQSDDIEVEKYFHVPGQDLVLRWIAPEKGGTRGMDTVMGKCSADMARLMGRKRNSNECFGACNRDGNPWDFSGSDMKWYIDWLGVRGVNLFIPHAFYYSLKGKRSGERPPDVGPGNIWWPHYRQWAEYMTRLSQLTAEAETEASIAVLCRNREMKAETVEPLFESQRSFQYIPESFWKECEERDGELRCREMRFKAVVGPAEMFPGVSHDPMRVAADCRCVPEQRELRVLRMRDGEREMWLCVNEGEVDMAAEITLPTQKMIGKYDLWRNEKSRAESAETEGGRRITLRLDRRESLLLFTCGDEGEWQALAEERKAARTLTGRDFTLVAEEPEACRKIYRAETGPCGGELTVRVEAADMVEMYVNGQLAEAAFWAPQKMRAPAEMLHAEKGNTIDLVVTGSRANVYGKRKVPYGITG